MSLALVYIFPLPQQKIVTVKNCQGIQRCKIYELLPETTLFL